MADTFGILGKGQVVHRLAIPGSGMGLLCGRTATATVPDTKLRILCAACEKILTESSAPATVSDSAHSQEDPMPPKAKTDTAALRAEVSDNTERVRTLTAEGKYDAASELSEATDTLIAKLPAASRAGLRATLRTARERLAEPTSDVVVHDYKAIEGLTQLVEQGATTLVDGIAAEMKGATIARRVAEVTLDIRRRITTKDGLPDIKGDTHEAKAASSDMYTLAGSRLKGSPEEVEAATRKHIRAVQNQRVNVLAEYLAGLDDSPEEAALYSSLTASDSRPVSQVVADHYGLSLPNSVGGKRVRRALGRPDADAPVAERASYTVRMILADAAKTKPAELATIEDESERDALKAQLREAQAKLDELLAALR